MLEDIYRERSHVRKTSLAVMRDPNQDLSTQPSIFHKPLDSLILDTGVYNSG